jgi:prepilin peptidase CpaA
MITLHDMPTIAGLSVTVVALVWAAASDVRRYLIPNRICALIAGGYALAGLGMPFDAWLAGLATGLALLAVGALLFWRGWVGGGDVKLAAVIALWAGPGLLSEFALVTSVAGVVLAAVMLSPLRRRMPRAAEGPVGGLAQPMPFGVALAAGGVSVAGLHLMRLLQGV